jgi:hypothetical protein
MIKTDASFSWTDFTCKGFILLEKGIYPQDIELVNTAIFVPLTPLPQYESLDPDSFRIVLKVLPFNKFLDNLCEMAGSDRFQDEFPDASILYFLGCPM